MTDERINELADKVAEYIKDLLNDFYDHEKGEAVSGELTRQEVETVAAEVDRAFTKAVYLELFKRDWGKRAKGAK